jgi:hypothetical protein
MTIRERLSIAGRVAAQSLPYLGVALVANIHPALAGIGGGGAGLGGIQTGATAVQNAAVGVGGAMAVGGVAFGAIHWAKHREDWLGCGERVGGGIAAGFIAGNAPAIAAIGGGGAIF